LTAEGVKVVRVVPPLKHER